MSYFTKITTNNLTNIIRFRNNEIKLGERINTPKDSENIENFIVNTDSQYIIFGIEEDFGVLANGGLVGTNKSWASFLNSFINIQNSHYLKGKKIGILGAFNFDQAIDISTDFNIKNADCLQKLYELVTLIDKEISYLITKIIEAGKTPIVIGGGHNNAYGNIKGLSLAKGKAINVVNFDAHTDFRNLEGRHSGNGFSYAYDHGFLKKYFVFGAHENYLSRSILKNIEATQGNVVYNTYEELMVREEKNFKQELQTALNHISNSCFGVEVDMDSIINIPASAQTPSGFSLEQARKFVHFFGSQKKASYLHICEAAPLLTSCTDAGQVGKAMAYIVSDFIKAKINITDK